MADELTWDELLRRWSEGGLSSSFADELPADVRAAGWLGFPPASDEQIVAAEARLKIPLPPSYKEFLRVSNGWGRTSPAIDRVWGTEEIGWFRKNDPQWVRSFTAPSNYGPAPVVPDE